ncbi:hypothetical protein MTR67_038976 [Solanum verrucosum]|uniref:Reverse transcriptase domain-containing protein n=1 Tax=Solanum verrucosum TaxID=315347 RepID=A0AAF0UH86_SOLVR|nr:hypothetical protein MTR67_038976 [Solanum verrucosum]
MDVMNMLFRQYLDMSMILFIDDILNYLRSENEHIDLLRIVLKILKDQQQFAKFSKYEFWQMSIAFLGHIVSSKGIDVYPKKTEAVKSWPRPLTSADIWSFLGLAGYYRSFQELKDRPTSTPVLTLPEGTYGFVVYYDASRTGLGQLSMGSVAHVEEVKKDLVRDVLRFIRFDIPLVDSTKDGVMVHNSFESSFLEDVKVMQSLDPILAELKEAVLKKSVEAFSQGGDGVLRYQGCLCVKNVDDLRE